MRINIASYRITTNAKSLYDTLQYQHYYHSARPHGGKDCSYGNGKHRGTVDSNQHHWASTPTNPHQVLQIRKSIQVTKRRFTFVEIAQIRPIRKSVKPFKWTFRNSKRSDNKLGTYNEEADLDRLHSTTEATTETRTSTTRRRNNAKLGTTKLPVNRCPWSDQKQTNLGRYSYADRAFRYWRLL